MNGKVLLENDYNFTMKEKLIYVFCCFRNNKYNETYIIYSDNLASNILHFGSVYFRDKTIVVMEVSPNKEEAIINFTTNYINNQVLEDYTLISLENIEKIELIGFNTKEIRLESINKLADISIPKVTEEAEEKEKMPFKAKLLIFFSIVLIVAIIVVLNYKDQLIKSGPTISCTIEYKHPDFNANVKTTKEFKYDLFKELYAISTKSDYTFYDKDEFEEFYLNGKYYEYKDTEDEEYTFERNLLTYHSFGTITDFIGYQKPTEYEKIKGYYAEYGYTCEESR